MDLSTTSLLAGRSDGPDVLGFSDPCMSRRHASVSLEDGVVRVTDLGAKNGVLCNGRKVPGAELRPNDVLRMGDTLLVYEGFEPSAPETDLGDDLLLGSNYEIRRARADVVSAAHAGLPATILGETGTGKELAAALYHRAAGRTGPLVAVNCAAIPEDLAAAALFGHRRGAFSGAVDSADGYFVAAHGGTIFLDEVGELPLAVQALLLRTLEDYVVTPVGATKGRRVDVRLVCATHRDLQARIEEGSFRLDLYSRIARYVIKLPPLRRRRCDIFPILARHLPEGATLTPDAAETVLLAPWPGNVRGLIGAVTRALASAPGQPISRRAILDALEQQAPTRDAPVEDSGEEPADREAEAPWEARRRPSRDELTRLLRAAHGRVAPVAESLGRTRKQVYRWLERYGIDLESFRQPDAGPEP